jgi:hypothetical protein
MIVSEKNISDALAYLAIDPHPVALARYELVKAENERKQAYARAFTEAEGSVEARRAQAELDTVGQQTDESEALLNLERHKARSRAAEMLIEVWRSENANVRAAERVR